MRGDSTGQVPDAKACLVTVGRLRADQRDRVEGHVTPESLIQIPIEHETAPFFEACERGELVIQGCTRYARG